MSDAERSAAEIAEWIGRQTGGPVEFARVEPGDELILPEPEQRELDGLPSRLDAKA